jgi:hypothetical protein
VVEEALFVLVAMLLRGMQRRAFTFYVATLDKIVTSS